jgi:hypothetical protein
MKQIGPIFIDFDLLENGSSPLVIVPKARRKRQLLVLINFLFSVLNVKETSSEPEFGPSYLLIAPAS